MYIGKTTKTHKGKTYDNYLLVESLSTPKGPRQKIVCSLGSLAPAPREHWLDLAHHMQASLAGQLALTPPDTARETVTARGRRGGKPQPTVAPAESDAVLAIESERVSLEEAREAGTVHVGHQIWQQLGLNEILRSAGLWERARQLSEGMTLNRLIFPLSEHAMPDWIRSTALADILGTDFASLNDEALYPNLDRLHPHRAQAGGTREDAVSPGRHPVPVRSDLHVF